tara:strand:+ start:168 stop:371 length:204 start_codon:yes stop_codon:yes gene_type:complete
MAKSVNLLKEALNIEETSISKFEEALAAMVHEESKQTVERIINGKKENIASVQKIIEQSRKCPAIQD